MISKTYIMLKLINNKYKNLVPNKKELDLLPKWKLVEKLLASTKPNTKYSVTSKSTHKGKSDNLQKCKDSKIKEPRKLPSLKEGSNFLELLLVLLTSIYSSDYINNSVYTSAIRSVERTYYHEVSHHGITHGTALFKSYTTYMIQLVEGRNPEPLTMVATSKDKLDVITKLDGLYPLVLVIKERKDGWQKAYQAFVTILAFPRLSEEIPLLNLQTVTEPLTNEKLLTLNPILKDFKEFIINYTLLKPWDMLKKPYIIRPRGRMTSGPNKGSTLAYSHNEGAELLRTRNLNSPFKSFCQIVGREDFYIYLTESCRGCEKDGTRLGKLTLVPDALNKHRMVAMLDIWTNLLLSPLEEIIRDILHWTLPHNDFLWNHSKGAEKVTNWTGKAWSIDLSSFTDRFPVSLQQIVVEKIMGNNLGQHWRDLLTNRLFWVEDKLSYVKYAVGQPMGAKSSFAVASLTHHMFVHYCHRLIPKELKGNSLPLKEAYVIVGDDIVFFCENLKDSCIKGYSNIGVGVALHKSKVPVNGTVFKEFCSRTSIDTWDVSRIPPGLIRNAANNWRDIPALILFCRSRGVELRSDLLEKLPYLNTRNGGKLKKDDPNSPTYLTLLKQTMSFPINGGTKIDYFKGDIDLPVGVEHWLIKQLAQCVLFLKASKSIAESFVKMKLINHISEDVLLDTLIDVSDEALPPDYWGLTSQMVLTAKDHFIKDGWKGSVPHLSSLTAAFWAVEGEREVFTLQDDIWETGEQFMFTESNERPSQDMAFQSLLKRLGRAIGWFDPKLADDYIITAGNQGKRFLRTQSSVYIKVISQLTKAENLKALLEGEGLFVFELDSLRFSLKRPFDNSPTNLFNNLMISVDPLKDYTAQEIKKDPMKDPKVLQKIKRLMELLLISEDFTIMASLMK